VPDILAQFENTGPLLIEVKAKAKQTLSFRPDYLERLHAYARLVDMPLLIAWKYHGIWTLFEARHLAKARKNFNIALDGAMKENLLGVLAGDVAYKIAPGAGIRVRFKREELIVVEKDGDTVTEQWKMRVDDVGYTIADGEPAGNLDPDVITLFTTWDLEEHQIHNDAHIEMHFLAGEEGMMFGHMALIHLLNWTLPPGEAINWRHAIRREAVVSNMNNFGHALKRALEQKVVHIILRQQPHSWPDFLPR
jgi:Holliday junction resolvase